MSVTDQAFDIPDTIAPQDILDAFSDGPSDDGINREAEKETALQAIAYLVGKSFKAAEASANEGVFSIGIKVTFDRNELPTSIKATARCSRVSKADIELSCPQDN